MLQVETDMLRKFRLNKKIRFVIWVLILWVCAHIIYITVDGLSEYDGSADVAVILGNRVLADGTLSSWLKGRTDAALELYKQKRIKKIIASGGISANEDGGYPEGNAMKEYLVSKGVPPGDVIADNAGINTYWTAKNYLELSKANNFQSVIVVSQFYHITRTKYIFRKLGVQNVHDVSSDVYDWRDIGGTLRELPAFYKYMFKY
jgi:vancomycin permeability regulator SanA